MYYDDRRFLVELRYDSDTLWTWAGSCTVCRYPQVEVVRKVCFSKSYVTLGLTTTSTKYQYEPLELAVRGTERILKSRF